MSTNANTYTSTATESSAIKASATAYAKAGKYSRAAREHVIAALRPHAKTATHPGSFAAWMNLAQDWKEFYAEAAAEHGIELSESAINTAWSRLVKDSGLEKPQSQTSSAARPASAGSANAGSGNPKPPRDAAYYAAVEAEEHEKATRLAEEAAAAQKAGEIKAAQRLAADAALATLNAQVAAVKAKAKAEAETLAKAEADAKAAKAKAKAAADTVREALADKDTAAFLVECLKHRAAIEMALRNAAAEEAGKPVTNAKPAGKARSKPTAKPVATPADPTTWSEAV